MADMEHVLVAVGTRDGVTQCGCISHLVKSTPNWINYHPRSNLYHG
jgi:hypothetical protein